MDFNKLTNKSQEAVARAQELARQAGNPEVLPEHLTVALPEQELPQTLLGDDAAAVRAQAEEALSRRARVSGAENLQPQASKSCLADTKTLHWRQECREPEERKA